MKLWQKYALALFVVALIPLGVATWQIVSHDVDKLGQSIRGHQVAAADVALGSVRRLVDEAVTGARTIGAALAMAGTPEERERGARSQLIGAKLVDNYTVYRPNGALVMEMRGRQEGPRLAPPETLDLDSRKITEAEGVLVSRVRRRDDGALMLPIVVAIRSADGALYAFGWTAVDLTALSEMVARLGQRHFGDPTLVRIVDEQLQVVASADEAELGTSLAGEGPLAGIESSAAFASGVAKTFEETRGGRELAGVVVGMDDLLWGVIVEEDRDAAYAAVSDAVTTALLVGAAFAVLALLLGFWSARRLARPVVSVSEAAQRVAAGDFAVRVDVGTGRDEVGQMAHAFNDMARDLGDYRDKLIEETRVRGDLSRFLSAEVVDKIVAGAGKLTLGGERRKITVMFADVVAFTDLVEQYPPEFVVGLLNELFTIVTEIVFKHGGIVDKFIGDCVMAIWGAPSEHADDAQRAVRAAEEIQHWLEVGNAKWRKQLGRDIELAIGIHTGEAVVGNVGSERRMEYTAIGDVVNVAARLERLAQPGQILITRETMEFVEHEFDGQSLGDVDIVGRNKTSEIFLLEE